MLLTNNKVVKSLGVLQEASKWGEIDIHSCEERVVATINSNYEFKFVEGENSKEVALLFKKNPDGDDYIIEDNELSRLTSKHKILSNYDSVEKFIKDPKHENGFDYYIFRTYKIVDDKFICFVKVELGEIDDEDNSEDKLTFDFKYEVANQWGIATELLRDLDKDLLKYLVK